MKVKEKLKNLLIVLLILSALYLAYTSWFYDNPSMLGWAGTLVDGAISKLFGSSGTFELEYKYSEAVMPFVISAKSGDIGRFAAHSGQPLYATRYNDAAQLLIEALGSSSGQASVSEAVWKEALRGDGIFFDYHGAIPVDVLSVWLSRDINQYYGYSARWFFISSGGHGVVLFIKEYESGAIYRYDTKIKFKDLEDTLKLMGPNGAKFSFESDIGNQLATETLFFSDYEYYLQNVLNPADSLSADSIDKLLRAFGMNPGTVEKYPDREGASIYVQELERLKICSNGDIVYQNPETYGAGDMSDDAAMLDTARALVQNAYTVMGGNLEVYICDFYRQGETATAVFGFSKDGIALIHDGSDYFARVDLTRGMVTNVSIKTVFLEQTDAECRPIPEKQAAIAAKDLEGESQLELRYILGDETAQVNWVTVAR